MQNQENSQSFKEQNITQKDNSIEINPLIFYHTQNQTNDQQINQQIELQNKEQNVKQNQIKPDPKQQQTSNQQNLQYGTPVMSLQQDQNKIYFSAFQQQLQFENQYNQLLRSNINDAEKFKNDLILQLYKQLQAQNYSINNEDITKINNGDQQLRFLQYFNYVQNYKPLKNHPMAPVPGIPIIQQVHNQEEQILQQRQDFYLLDKQSKTIQVYCKACQQISYTQFKEKESCLQICCCLILLPLPPCCLIPFNIKKCYKRTHHCRKCNFLLYYNGPCSQKKTQWSRQYDESSDTFIYFNDNINYYYWNCYLCPTEYQGGQLMEQQNQECCDCSGIDCDGMSCDHCNCDAGGCDIGDCDLGGCDCNF